MLTVWFIAITQYFKTFDLAFIFYMLASTEEKIIWGGALFLVFVYDMADFFHKGKK